MDGGVTLFSASFDTDEEGFVFRDDAFRDTNQPIYADGQRVPAGGFSGGALQVLLGGVDDADINSMSGGWDREFNLAEAQQVTLTFRVKLTQSENYEPDEFSEALVSLDGTLLSAGGGEAIATINGNGNGGGERTTDWLEIEIDLGLLEAGDHTLTFGGFNNKKTLANESTEILFDDIEVKAAPPPPDPGEGVLIDADFDTNTNGFNFLDDAFRGTNQPGFADGQRTATDGFSGGGLEVTLGGVDDSDVNGMSGGWVTSFNLAEEAVVTISFRYNLTQAPNYEANEFSQVLLSLDGNLVGTDGNDFIDQINGNGNGGPEITTGWQVVEINLGLLGPGNHDLIIGGFNNRKTLADEETTLLIDDVLVRDLPPPPPGDVVLIQSDFDTDTGGFGFIDDAFRGTSEPDFADGQRTPDGGFGGGGALRVELGGIDDSDVLGMSGGWGQSFELTEETNVKLSFRFRLTQNSDYENDEFSQVLVSLNGTLVGLNGEDFIAQITGNGNGGPDRVVGWQVVELDLGLLGPGTHDLILGGFNNKKTFANEVTEILFDDLLLTAAGTAPEPPVIESIFVDTGASNADGITSDNDLLVSGTAEPNATVELFLDGATSLGTVLVDGAGQWSIQTGPIPDGPHTLTATATDAANNTSGPSAGFAIVIDTIAPGIPVVTGIADDSGTPGDGITNDTDLLVSGLGEAGTIVELFLDGVTSLGTAVVDGSGNWSIQTGPIGEGPHTLSARATDVAGNPSPFSSDFNIEIDTAAPDAPIIVGIADDNGALGNDGVTNDNDLLVSGTAEIGATVELFLDGVTSLGTAVADGSGNWSIQTGVIIDGPHSLTATATDVAGNPSGPSAGFAIEIDTVAPGAPSIVSIADDTGAPGDGITTDNDLLVSGTAEVGATVELFLDGATSLGTAVADGLGNWSIQTGVIAIGAHVLTATATDLAGNTSAASAGFNIEIESVAPDAPTIESIADDTGVSNADGITSDNDLLVSGTAEPGSTVELFLDGVTSLGTTTADGTTGAWSIQTGPLAEGPATLTATATDGANNTSGPSAGFDIEIDTIPPGRPAVIGIADDSGTPGDGITNDNDLLVSGTAEPGATVELFLDGAPSLGTAVVDEFGNWSIQTGPIAEGPHTLNARATDLAGNPSPFSFDFNIDIDTTAPDAPSIVGIADDTGALGNDGVTNDNDLLVSGTAAVGATVELFLDGSTSLGTAVADGLGNWSIQTGPLGDGAATLTATATDVAGNPSVPSAGFAIEIDTSAPGVPTIVSIADDTDTPGDGITTDNDLLVSGTAEPGATVELFLDGVTSLGTTTADGTTGAWSIQTGPLADGAATLTATATDLAGNASAPSAGFDIEIDTAAPAAPTIVGIADDNGASGSDGVTNDNDLLVSGTAEIGATVELFLDGVTSLGTAVVDGTGNWSIQTGPIAEGAHTLTARATDLAGGTSPFSLDFDIVIDTAAPAAPSIVGIADDNGALGSDGVTNDTDLLVSGTAEIGATVELFLDGVTSLGTAVVDGTGNWSIQTGPIADGAATLTATATDLAGNASGPSADFDIEIDTVAPDAPSIVGVADDNGALGNDGVTNDTDLLVSGTAEAGATVELFLDGVTSLGTAVADGSGNWSIQTGPLADGAATLTATATDLAGNASAPSAGFDIEIDTTAPDAPVIVGIADDNGALGNDGVTNDNDLLVSGTAEVGATIELFLDGVTSLGTAVADGSGNWSIQTGPIAEGAATLTATATDVAGNASAPSAGFAIEIDTVAPDAPTIVSIADDTGVSNADGITNDDDLLVSGTAEAGATVELFLDGVTSLGTAVADGSGDWSIQTGPIADGAATLTATATDLAGNASDPSAGFDIEIDTAAPNVPSIVGIADDSGTPGDGITNDNDLLVSGTAEVGATVELFLDGVTSLGTAVADGLGNWSIQTGPLADGAATLTATATDLAGNVSAPSAGFDIEIDTAAPDAPSIVGIADDNGALGNDGVTNDNDLLVSGTAEAGATVELFLDGATSLGTAVADGSGNWSIQTGPLADGAATLTATATDVAGNASAPSAGFAIEIDTVLPDAPTIVGIADDTDTPGDGITSDNDLLVSGTAEAGATVELFLDSVTSLGTAVADGLGNWSIQTGPLANGAATLTATATDLAGNVSAPSAGFDIEIQAPPLVIELSLLDGSNGFVIAGIDQDDQAGFSVSGAGDVNGDGFEDVIVGAQYADGGPGNSEADAGESYVVFGKASGFGSVLELSSLDGSNGFVLAGIDGGDFSGGSVSGAGDVNGDGLADLIVGAIAADGIAGESYVVFGQATGFGSLVALSSLDGSNGFLLSGVDAFDRSGRSVSGAGDVNGDGLDDLIIGSANADAGTGESYVVFGQATGFGSVVELASLDGSNGFLLPGIDGVDSAGFSVSSAGDVNGDGLADLIVGALYARGGPGNPTFQAGEAYVVFGRTSGFGSVLQLSSLDGSNGFLIAGSDLGDRAGRSVSAAGDVNGDGFADVIVGAFGADTSTGESYVVFGQASGFGSVIAQSSLDGSNGFVLAGIDAGDSSGISVSGAGDVNGDGLEDLIIGAPGNSLSAPDTTGESYVVFGRATGFGSVLDLGALTADRGFVIAGIDADDRAGVSVSGAGDLNGDGFADLIVGARDADGGPDNAPDGAGESYVIFGGDFTGAVTQLGDDTANSLIGSGAVDVLLGAQGNDLLDGNGGADVLYGGEGDDEIRISDDTFLRIDGGTGTDTVVIDAPNTTIDLTQIRDSKIQGIEQFDLNGATNTLILSPLEVLNLSDTSNRLLVFGEPGDEVQASGDWIQSPGFVDIDGTDFVRFTSGAAELLIEDGVTATLNATVLVNLDALDGANGFVIAGIDQSDYSGISVSGAGDVNGDGFADLIVGAYRADGGPGDPVSQAGESYVVFGAASGFGSVLNLSSLDGSNGFVLAGIDLNDRSGFSVSGAGDVNGDGFADLIVGAYNADGGPGDPANGAGESYVVFGQASGFGSVLELSLLGGSNGFLLVGDLNDRSGFSVSGAGDVNGDGLADLIIGASDADGGPGNPANFAGESYVVFGKASGFGSLLQLSSLDGSNGFILAGIDGGDFSGTSVSSAGDVNGDGFADLIVGANGAGGTPGNTPADTGESYVVFGRASGFGSVLDLSTLDGSNGFLLAGIDEGDGSARSVSGAGDVNGDGFADIIIGAYQAYGGPGNPAEGAGESYVVFGAASGFGSLLQLSSLDGSNGFLLAGIDGEDYSGISVSGAGDVNGDGFDDLIVAAYGADGGPGNPADQAGESYVVFGRATGFGSVLDLSSLDGTNGFPLAGIDAYDRSGGSVSGAGDVNGDGFADIIIGAYSAYGGPGNPTQDAGESYLIFGGDFTGAVTELGDETANTLTGTGAVDVLLGAQGDDELVGGGGADVLYGGEGDDEIRISDDGFFRIDGGTGTDTVVIDQSNTTIDLTQIADSKLTGIEQFDLNGATNTLILSPLEVLNLSDTSNRLLVFGEPGDEVQASGDWIQDFNLVNVDGTDFVRFTSGAAELLVEDGVTASLNATAILALSSLDGSNGFVIAGIDESDYSGRSVSGAGDVNGDGFEDVIVGAFFGDGGPDDTPDNAGESYVIFGRASGFGSVLTLSSLDGSNGFVLAGIDDDDGSGHSVSGAGDVNGDGFADLIVGAYAADQTLPNGSEGESYVVFGAASGFGSVVELSSLDGSNGFIIAGIDEDDYSGRSVSGAGDVNGDGFADLIVGASFAEGGPGNPAPYAGESYVIFGRASGFGSVLTLSSLDGSNGFVLAGIDDDDGSGHSVSGAGDVNGDGFADLIVGARIAAGGPDNTPEDAGESYVVFGAASGFGSVLALSTLDGSNGFLLAGIDANDVSGRSVSGAGDVNGDGFADLIVGAYRADGGPDNTPGDAGESYVVFGAASGFGSVLQLSSLDGSNGFVLAGIGEGDYAGFSVSGAGDVNGDGLDDLIVGARYADGGPGNPTENASESYLVFGRASGFGSVLDLGALTADRGFVIAGIDIDDQSSFSVSGAGDVNGDGFADLIVGAPNAGGGPGNPTSNAGESYVIFGGDFTDSVTELGDDTANSLNGTAGADVLLGAQGDDTLVGNGDADVLYGGEGDDRIVVSDLSFLRVDGGSGNDTLVIDAPGTTIDLTQIADSKLQGIEQIDLNFDSNTLTLSPLEVLNLSDSSNRLVVFGEPGNEVQASGDWIQDVGLVNVDGTDFVRFTSGAAELLIEDGVTATLNATPVLALSSLDGSNGFVIAGIDGSDRSGRSVSAAGDVNGDGFEDVIVGAPNANSFNQGESYVVFGRAAGFGSVVELSSLDGSNGFLLTGVDLFDESGASVSGAGDVNGDGIADLIIGAPGERDFSPAGTTGESYVVFGQASGFGSVVALSSLDGSNGFVLAGVDEDDYSGFSVSGAGDVNGDGFADLIVGTYFAEGGPDNTPNDAGESYVIFGQASGFGSVVELSSLDGSNGFLLAGIDPNDKSGASVSGAGDVNGDGFADLIVGARLAHGGPDNLPVIAGESYVIFGQASGFGSVLELSSLDGSNGFVIAGIDQSDTSGSSVSGAGDVNGDGLADLIIGAIIADGGPDNAPENAGESYVVFGQASGFGSVVELSSLDGSNGFVLAGIDGNDRSGVSVSGAGDVNGDGLDDLIIGAILADGGPGNPANLAGESYVVFGRASGFGSVLDLDALTADQGFVVAGIDQSDFSGQSVSGAGDLNGDGFADLIVGASLANGGPDNTPSQAGESYVIFGGDFTGAVTELGDETANTLTGTGGTDVLLGAQGNDVLDGNGGADVLYGGEGDDEIHISDDGFFRIDGGTGTDTVVIDQPNTTIDLTQIADSKLQGIEQIDLNGATNTLILSPLEVLNLSDTSNRLLVFGEPGGEVQASGDWIQDVGLVNVDGTDFVRFTSGAAELLIEDGVTASLNATPVLALSSLDGANGFVIAGIDMFDSSGRSVSGAGDVNGDGFEDVIVGARYANGGPDNTPENAGESYVVFGRASGFGSVFELSSLDGSNGFILAGIDENDLSGHSVSGAGDVNGDGFADLIVGAYGADQTLPNGREGESYVVFGAASGFGSVLSLSSLDGSNGFILAGIGEFDYAGFSVSGAGDVNGDGFADVIVGARYADGGPGDPTIYAGESYLVFGRASGFGSVVELSSLDGSNGFLLAGIDAGDYSGISVSGAGDVNGDGFADLIVGAYRPDQTSPGSQEGESYVVFGRASGFGSVLALSTLDGSNGFLLAGIDENDYAGRSVSGAGDVNGDGFADIIVGADSADPNGLSSGESYLVFGAASGFGSVLQLSSLDGSNGFLLAGIDAVDYSGFSVSGAGDVNGDGLDDLIIGTNYADGGPGDPTNYAGESYLVFGRASGFGSVLDLSSLDASRGFLLAGIDVEDYAGRSVSGAGDVNGDGFADLIVGAREADGGPGNPTLGAGESYVIFGGDFTGSVTELGDDTANTLTGSGDADVLLGAQGDDTLVGNGGADVLYGGEGDDRIVVSDLDFLRVDGGTGTDTLVIDAPGTTIDLTQIADSKLRGIEQIDLNFDSNTLILSPLEVLNLSDTSNRLVVFGEPGDTVQVSGSWTSQGFEIVDGAQTTKYVSGGAELLVQTGVTTDFTDGTPSVVVALSSLDGTNGFVFKGIDDFDRSGFSVGSAGDVNGDGFEDVIIGAYYADQGAGNTLEGESYLLFGGAANLAALDAADGTADGMIELSNLDGSNGFILKGIDEGDRLGRAVTSAGDVNGDGFADLIIGASLADQGASDTREGKSYLVFGGAANLTALDAASGTDGMIELSDLDGVSGFIFQGIDEEDASGFSVTSAGDVNGDGFDDLIIGARYADQGAGDTREGESYLVFGGAANLAALDAADSTADGVILLSNLDGTSGFVFKGIDASDRSGRAVSSAGDVNGDGFDDLLIGADSAAPNGALSGESYLVFGGAANLAALDAADTTADGMIELSNLDGSNGFVFKGIDFFDLSGRTIASAGDVDGDGFDDLLIGAFFADQSGGSFDNEGESYLLFGGAANLAALDAVDGTDGMIELSDLTASTGYVFKGIDSRDYSGFAIASAGDVNGDGFDDLIVGASTADQTGSIIANQGETYLVFGGAANLAALDEADGVIDGMIELANLGSGGLLLPGIDDDDLSGFSASSAGDVNGDGFDDLMIGAPGGPTSPLGTSGESYLIYGGDFTGAVTETGDAGANELTGTGDPDVLLGALGDDTLIGNGGADVLYGGEGDDRIAVSDLTFQRVDGGTGTDTLVIDAPGTTIDLTTIADSKLQGIEQIDLNFDSNTLILSPLEVLNLSDSSNRLVVFGEPGDEVQASGEWIQDVGLVNVDGTDFVRFTSGEAELLIQDGVTATLNATPVVALSSLDGSNGFVIVPFPEGGAAGSSVSGAGDVNGDGFEDVIIGAAGAKGRPGNTPNDVGESYVVFGKASGFGSLFELSSLDGSNGFVLAGIDGNDRAGISVSGAGDVNGDGFADLIVGTKYSDGGPGNTRANAGEAYVVFGKASGFGSVLDLSSLDGSNGFLLAGIDEFDYAGFSVSGAGDVNGDGFDDLIVGAYGASSEAGETYVVFGQASGFGSVLDLSSLDGSNGFILTGIDGGDLSGRSVSGAGDVNGDGLDDLIIGAENSRGGPGNPAEEAGEAYVVFGRTSGFGSVLDLSSLDGSNGFLLAGVDEIDLAGNSVSGAGDVNGDGFADLIIGARYGDGGPGNPATYAGESYVVFGKASGFSSVLSLSALDGSNGFVIAGIDADDGAGMSVSNAGDVNGDGIDDLIIGTRYADGGPGNPTLDAGEAYIVFGRTSGFGSLLNLSELSADQGFVIAGIDELDRAGRKVSGAGDVNGDGFADIIVGANYAEDNAGESYIIFGGDFTGDVTQQGDETANTLTGTGGADGLLGAQDNDVLDGNGGADVLYGGEGDDEIRISDDSFLRIDGGTGTDTVVIDVADTTLDLTAIADSKIQGIEQIDLNFDSNTLILSPLEVLNLSDSSNRLLVFGEPGNEVQASGDWLQTPGLVNVDGTDFVRFTSGAAELLIQDGVTATLNATPVLQLSSLDGADGFLLAGIDQGDVLGTSVSGAGDVNGDGFEDLIVGAPIARGGPTNPTLFAGDSYVVFGRASGFGSTVDLSSLDGSNGFLLVGTDADFSGHSVSRAGDVNGDGFADLIVGAYLASSGPDNLPFTTGEAYVVFGQASGFGSVLASSSLDGNNGFTLAGIDSGDRAGWSVSGAGDVNGDGFADLIVGALNADQSAGNTLEGESYVIFGAASGFASVLELSSLDGSNGFVLTGIDEQDRLGISVSGAGDVNGDGLDDLIIGASYAEQGAGNTQEGESYVVFGTASGFGSLLALSSLDGNNGFVLAGIDQSDRAGHSVSGAGDVNGDGIGDLIVGARLAGGGPDGTPLGAGESYVVFGQTSGFGSLVELSALDGSNGFVIAGIDAHDNAGFSVSGAGDVNGDGLDDLIIGAPGSSSSPADTTGESYLVFGRATGFGSLLELDNLTADQGFVLAGIDGDDLSGRSVSGAVDVNGDGFADLIVGARAADGGPDNTSLNAGEAYVIFGGDFSGAVTQQGDAGANELTGSSGIDVLLGAQGNDTLIGNGGADVLYGGEGDDILAISDDTIARLRGGTGEDTLRLDGAGFSLDLTALSDLKIEEIEIIDLQEGIGAHSLTLDLQEVLNISDTSNSLTILGDGDDSVDIGAGWTSQGTAGGFETFTQGAATLVIDEDITIAP